jgi:gluconolactonase
MRLLLLILLAGGCTAEPVQQDDMAQPSSDLAPYPNPIAGVGAPTEVQGGFMFTEGPLWRAADGVLLFSDVQGNRIHKLTPPSTFEVFRDPSGNANGLALDAQGLLVACEGGMKRVTRTLANGTVMSIASMNAGAALNSPNDVIVRSDGTIYFTDPNYAAPANKTQAFEGVFRISPQGTLSTVDTGLQRPNGIALSPDEKTLYVADQPMNRVMRYTVNPDGSTSAATSFITTAGSPDGMAVDDAGNLYVAAAGIEVFDPAGATIGTVMVPKAPANCTFGGADRRTLYITARSSLYQVRLNVPGRP